MDEFYTAEEADALDAACAQQQQDEARQQADAQTTLQAIHTTLQVALMQSCASDDPIIIGHVREAHELAQEALLRLDWQATLRRDEAAYTGWMAQQVAS